MKKNMINIIIINFVIVWILNRSGFMFDFSKWLYGKTHKDKVWKGQFIGKPFGCALCMTFWITFIYCLFSMSFIYSIGIACLSSLLTSLTSKIIGLVEQLIERIP